MINSEGLYNIIKEYGTNKNTIDKIQNIFLQGDSRYSDPEYEAMVSGFLDNNAISIEERKIEKKIVNTNNIKGPQKQMKATVIGILRNIGYKIISMERGFMGGIPDVLARKGDFFIAVECGPCNVRKAIDYLENDNTSLWIIRPERNKYSLFVLSKSASWNTFYEFYKKTQFERIREYVEAAFRTWI